MKTLEAEVEDDDRSAKKATISFPGEIIEDILSRLPVKSILRFRSVSKPWLSHISQPSFTKLHITRATPAHRKALFITAHEYLTSIDYLTSKLYLLSSAHDGGPVTHIMTLDNTCSPKSQHLNGLVLFTCKKLSPSNARVFIINRSAHTTLSPPTRAFVINPSTHKTFELPHPPYIYNDEEMCTNYLFGFDESSNEHKIMIIWNIFKPLTAEIAIFSLSNYSWRKINVEPPHGFRIFCNDEHSVCVNSVVHLLLSKSFDILAFDLTNEKFSVINTPRCILPRDDIDVFGMYPYMIKIKGCIGVVCQDFVYDTNEIYIWILQDYENRVWVRETIKFPEPWITFGYPLPDDSEYMDEIIFSSSKFSENEINVPVYNKKSRCFKSLQFTPGHQFLFPTTLAFDKIRCYVESMVPL